MLIFVGGKRQLDVARPGVLNKGHRLSMTRKPTTKRWILVPTKKNTFLSYQGGPEKKIYKW